VRERPILARNLQIKGPLAAQQVRAQNARLRHSAWANDDQNQSIGFLALAIVCALLNASCSRCVDIELQEATSPNGEFSATVLERHCNGPNDFAQRLFLSHHGWLSIFERAKESFALNGLASLQIDRTADSRSLNVWYSGGTVLEKLPGWKNVSFIYHEPQSAAMASIDEAPEATAEAPPKTSETGIWHGGNGRRGFGHAGHRSNDQ
jgi:hypothetical protein